MPLSATLTEEEAATIIQAFFRGYLVRRDQKAQLFRTWQRNVWEERKAAEKIKTFWKKKSTTRTPNPDKLERKPGDVFTQERLEDSGDSLEDSGRSLEGAGPLVHEGDGKFILRKVERKTVRSCRTGMGLGVMTWVSGWVGG